MRLLCRVLLFLCCFFQAPELMAMDDEDDPDQVSSLLEPLVPHSQDLTEVVFQSHPDEVAKETDDLRESNFVESSSSSSSRVSEVVAQKPSKEVIIRGVDIYLKKAPRQILEFQEEDDALSERKKEDKGLVLMSDEDGLCLIKDSEIDSKESKLADALLRVSEEVERQNWEFVPLNNTRKKKKIPEEFIKETDLILIRSPSSFEVLRCRDILGGCVAVAAGTAVTVFSTGVNRQSMENLSLDPHRETDAGTAAVTFTYLMFWGPITGEFLTFMEKVLRPSYSSAVLTARNKLMFPISRAHTILKGCTGAVVSIAAFNRLVQMVEAETRNVETETEKTQAYTSVAFVAIPYFLADALLNWHNASNELNHHCYTKSYLQSDATRTRQAIIGPRFHRRGKSLIKAPNSEITRIFDAITEQNTEKEWWKVSLLIAEASEAPEEELKNFVRITTCQRIADYLVQVLNPFAMGGRALPIFWGGRVVLHVWFGLPEPTAFWISLAPAFVGSIGRTLWESKLHHDTMRKFFCCKERDVSPDGIGTQIVTNLTAVGGATLLTVAEASLGMQWFGSSYPVAERFLWLGSAAVFNLNSNFHSLRRGARAGMKVINRLFNWTTGCCISEARKERRAIQKKREFLIELCVHLGHEVETLNDKAIHELYELITKKEEEGDNSRGVISWKA